MSDMSDVPCLMSEVLSSKSESIFGLIYRVPSFINLTEKRQGPTVDACFRVVSFNMTVEVEGPGRPFLFGGGGGNIIQKR